MEDRLQDYVLYAGPIGHGRNSEVHKARKMVGSPHSTLPRARTHACARARVRLTLTPAPAPPLSLSHLPAVCALVALSLCLCVLHVYDDCVCMCLRVCVREQRGAEGGWMCTAVAVFSARLPAWTRVLCARTAATPGVQGARVPHMLRLGGVGINVNAPC